MRSFLAGCAAAIVIALLGWAFLSALQEPVTVAFSTQEVRL